MHVKGELMDQSKPPISGYIVQLKQSRVPPSQHAEYLQWLRYYLDFCGKHALPDSKSERVRLFCEKLNDKKQTPKQQQRAAHAVSLYFAMLKQERFGGSRGYTEASNAGRDAVGDQAPAESTAELSISTPIMVTPAGPERKLASTQSVLSTSKYVGWLRGKIRLT